MVLIEDFTKPLNRPVMALVVATATAVGFPPFAMYAGEPWVLGVRPEARDSSGCWFADSGLLGLL